MSKKTTVGETIQKIEHLSLKQAVLDEVCEYLGHFIATDSFQPAKGISSPLSGEAVPQETIVEVRDELFAKKVEYETDIQELKGQSVSAAAKTEKKAPTKKAVRRAPPKRRKANARQKKAIKKT
jgi:hypothetical protein